jgi:hypothetical protein
MQDSYNLLARLSTRGSSRFAMARAKLVRTALHDGLRAEAANEEIPGKTRKAL